MIFGNMRFPASLPDAGNIPVLSEPVASDPTGYTSHYFLVDSHVQRNLKRNLNQSRPFEHHPVRAGNVKTLRWDDRLQIQNICMAFEQVPRW